MDWSYNVLGPDPVAGVMVVFILILIEGILSVDNAAVLATMVMHLPAEQRSKALRYGILGAYLFRGICLALASWLIKIWWLEPVGGLYLLWLAAKHFTRHESVEQEGAEAVATEGNWLLRHTLGRLGPFWSTVFAVEVMDLASPAQALPAIQPKLRTHRTVSQPRSPACRFLPIPPGLP